MEVKRIETAQAKSWFLEKHYAKRMKKDMKLKIQPYPKGENRRYYMPSVISQQLQLI